MLKIKCLKRLLFPSPFTFVHTKVPLPSHQCCFSFFVSFVHCCCDVTSQLFSLKRGGASDPKNPNLYYSVYLFSKINFNISIFRTFSSSPEYSYFKMAKGSGLTKPMKLSADLAEIVGKKEASRAECIKQLWAYLKKNNLQDPENKQFFTPDKKMAKVLKARFLWMRTQ